MGWLRYRFRSGFSARKARICYRRAHQEDPGNPEAQRHYADTLTAAQQLSALEAYLANPAGHDDPEIVDQIQRQIEALKWARGGAFILSSPLEHTEIKLSHLMSTSSIIRGFALPVSFNGGKTMRLMMDSGAGGILLNEKAAQAAIGDVLFKNCPVGVSDRKFITGEDGLIGTDVLSAFLITIDFHAMVLKLDPLPRHKATTPDPNWQDREVAPELSNFTPFWSLAHHILLTTRVNNARPVLFLIDTGASASLIDPAYARQFTGVRSEDLVTMGGISGKVKKVQSAGQLTFEFGHYRQPVPGVLAVPLTGVNRNSPQITGIFGITTLASYRLQIDYRDGLINLEYIGPKY